MALELDLIVVPCEGFVCRHSAERGWQADPFALDLCRQLKRRHSSEALWLVAENQAALQALSEDDLRFFDRKLELEPCALAAGDETPLPGAIEEAGFEPGSSLLVAADALTQAAALDLGLKVVRADSLTGVDQASLRLG